eukprot:TRINITY_DN8240_c0_g1_i2.p1 TRINITY_DN8240_c0_g1~~TRINITY_DN8240_c0_g1_i2.p1  ORF type:complete len:121 (-),score=43.12 TRINITY_DN8240_c0_g1_i2:196-558(-)
MNEPDRYEIFALAPNQKKVTYQKDTKVKDAASFTLQKEDHTLGNILRMQLLRDRDVLFAGYKAPHPLEHYIILRIQTTPKSNPQKALETAIRDLIDEASGLEEKFKIELERKKQDRPDYY